MDGWIDGCVRVSTSLSTVFKLYRDDGRVDTKGSVQRSAV